MMNVFKILLAVTMFLSAQSVRAEKPNEFIMDELLRLIKSKGGFPYKFCSDIVDEKINELMYGKNDSCEAPVDTYPMIKFNKVIKHEVVSQCAVVVVVMIDPYANSFDEKLTDENKKTIAIMSINNYCVEII